MSEVFARRKRAIDALERTVSEMKGLGTEWEPRQYNEKIDLDVNAPNGRVTFQIVWNSTEDVLELTKEIASKGGKTPIGTKHALEGINISTVIQEIKSNL